jgi:hypothetical protein
VAVNSAERIMIYLTQFELRRGVMDPWVAMYSRPVRRSVISVTPSPICRVTISSGPTVPEVERKVSRSFAFAELDKNNADKEQIIINPHNESAPIRKRSAKSKLRIFITVPLLV